MHQPTIDSRKASCQQKVLCNWGSTLKQSSAVHIQASYPADVILPGNSSKLQLLFINLASVTGRQLANSPTAQSLNRWLLFPLLGSELQKLANVFTFIPQREIGRLKIGVHNPGAIQVEMYKFLQSNL